MPVLEAVLAGSREQMRVARPGRCDGADCVTESAGALRPLLHAGFEQLRLEVDDARLDGLIRLLDLVAQWSRSFSLTALSNPREMAIKHVLDSASIVPWLVGTRWLDVGSGAGFPGLVLAILRPDAGVCCLDSSLKKTRFITQAARQIALDNVQVHRARLRDLATRQRSTGEHADDAVPFDRPMQFDTVVSRATMSPAQLALQAMPLLAADGRVLGMLGRDIQVQPADGYQLRIESLQVPFLEASRHLAVFCPSPARSRV